MFQRETTLWLNEYVNEDIKCTYEMEIAESIKSSLVSKLFRV